MMKNASTITRSLIRVIVPKIIYVGNILLIIFLLFFPREVLSAAQEGLVLWFNSVLPALLPFIIAINLLTALGFVRLVSIWAKPLMVTVFKLPGAGGFALITGLLSGYPMGAKTVADLYRNHDITVKEAQRLLFFCNNAGPLFIVGVVGVGLLGNSTAGYVLWAGHVAAALAVGVLTRGWNRHDDSATTRLLTLHNKTSKQHIGKALGESVKNAMEALLVVGGLIIFFSVVVKAITTITGNLPFMAEGMLAGFLEITGGVKILSETTNGIISPGRIAVIGGIISFGGFSVHAQALHFTSDTGIKASTYILFKAIGGIIATGFTWVLWSFLLSVM